MLELQHLSVRYGPVRAVEDLNITVNDGDIVALLGANGAGKTTVVRAISGLLRLAGGQVVWQGQTISGKPPDHIARMGIAHVPEGREVFPDLTVYENLLMGSFGRHSQAGFGDDVDRAFALFPRLKERRGQSAGTLSGGEQQMLVIGRALVAQPKLLLLDEPSLGVAPQMVTEIFTALRAIHAETPELSIILVEQNAYLALRLASWGAVLTRGSVTLSGPADVLMHHDEVVRSYLA